MTRFARKEFTAFSGLLIGLVFFPLLQWSGSFFLREGLITFWIRQSLGTIVLPAPAPLPAPEPEPDRTRPLAVMIDNHPLARPQSGIAAADAVWEAPVEGGLTRTMAIFRSASATEIGPVRSARPYFLEWASEVEAVYVHVGGSDEALAMLSARRLPLDDANEFSNGAAFWRDSRRSAPHNTYTSIERLRQLIGRKEWDETTDAVDQAKRSRESATGTPATRIDVNAIFGADPCVFRWDPRAKSYVLWRRGREARDREGTLIAPATVVALEMRVLAVRDPEGKGLIGLETVGSGPATVFRDGIAVPGTWRKASAEAPTLVYDAHGQKIPFAEGQAWYAVIGANRGGSVTFE